METRESELAQVEITMQIGDVIKHYRMDRKLANLIELATNMMKPEAILLFMNERIQEGRVEPLD